MLVLAGSAALLLFEDGLAVFIKLESSDGAVAGVDGELSCLAVFLLLYDFLNVNASASAVDGEDFTLKTF